MSQETIMINSMIADLETVAGSDREKLKQGFERIRKAFPNALDYIDTQELFVYEKRKMYDDALAVANKILEKKPDDYTANLRKARILGIYRRYNESTVLFEKLLVQPSLDKEKYIIVTGHYAKMLLSAERRRDAILVLERAVKKYPDAVALKTKLAICYKRIAMNEKALEILKTLPGDDAYVRMEKAHVYINMLKPDAAEKELKAAEGLFELWRLNDKRLQNQHERRSIAERLTALKIALKAVRGEATYARKWLEENHKKSPAAKLVGVTLSIIEKQGGERSGKEKTKPLSEKGNHSSVKTAVACATVSFTCLAGLLFWVF